METQATDRAAASPAETLAQARRLYESGAHQEALRALGAIREDADPVTSRDCFVLLGDLLARCGRGSDAVDSYHEALAIEPGHVPARVGRAAALMLCERWDEAREKFETILADDPSSSRALFGLGLIAQAKGELPAALGWLSRSYEEGGDPAHVVRLMLELSSALRSFEMVEGILDDCVASHPEEAHFAYAHAGVLYRLGRNVEAAKVCRSILARTPDHEDARTLLELAESGPAA